jgi:uncharacterized membrane protein
MPSLTAWPYPTASGAGSGELQLKLLVERGALTVHDAATAVWMPHDPAPRVRRTEHLRAKAAGSGGLWGALAGLVVLNPVAGAAVGAAAGAAVSRLRHAGLDAEFVQRVQEHLTPGTSALLVLSSGADPEQVRKFVEGSEAVLLFAELSEEGQKVLDTLGRVEDAGGPSG